MSENAMHLQIVTPHGRLYDAETLGVRVESVMGQMELLPDHEPLIAALEIGAAVVKREEGDLHFALNHGYVEVMSNRIEIVVETAEEASAIDIPRAEQSKANAEAQAARYPRRVSRLGAARERGRSIRWIQWARWFRCGAAWTVSAIGLCRYRLSPARFRRSQIRPWVLAAWFRSREQEVSLCFATP